MCSAVTPDTSIRWRCAHAHEDVVASHRAPLGPAQHASPVEDRAGPSRPPPLFPSHFCSMTARRWANAACASRTSAGEGIGLESSTNRVSRTKCPPQRCSQTLAVSCAGGDSAVGISSYWLEVCSARQPVRIRRRSHRGSPSSRISVRDRRTVRSQQSASSARVAWEGSQRPSSPSRFTRASPTSMAARVSLPARLWAWSRNRNRARWRGSKGTRRPSPNTDPRCHGRGGVLSKSVVSSV